MSQRFGCRRRLLSFPERLQPEVPPPGARRQASCLPGVSAAPLPAVRSSSCRRSGPAGSSVSGAGGAPRATGGAIPRPSRGGGRGGVQDGCRTAGEPSGAAGRGWRRRRLAAPRGSAGCGAGSRRPRPALRSHGRRPTVPSLHRGSPPAPRLAIGRAGAGRQWDAVMLGSGGRGQALLAVAARCEWGARRGEASPAPAPPTWGAARAATAAGRSPSGWMSGSKCGCCRASG